jgi:hypothetical protein
VRVVSGIRDRSEPRLRIKIAGEKPEEIRKLHDRNTLSHLHPSLANRAHLSAYIASAKKEHFPHGTDWKGEQPSLLQSHHLIDFTFLQECSTSSVFKMSSFPATSTTFV